MMAAHDTITSSISSLVWLLARHPEWQDRLRAEMLAVAPAGEGVGHTSLGQLELTEWAFKAALRMIPPVPVLPRRPLRDFEFVGYRIPAAPNVGVNPPPTTPMADHCP